MSSGEELMAEPYVFYLDTRHNMCAYSNEDGESKVLFSIHKETGSMLFRNFRFETRPKRGIKGANYRFLVVTEQDR